MRIWDYTTFSGGVAEVWEEVPPIPPGTAIKSPIPPYITSNIKLDLKGLL
jgi:hypothetical protein